MAVAVAAASWLPACSSGSSECDRFTTSAFDPQAWPHPTARAAVDDFLRSDLARERGITGRFEFERLLPRTASTVERAVLAEADRPGELTVQHGGRGWAVGGFDTCLD